MPCPPSNTIPSNGSNVDATSISKPKLDIRQVQLGDILFETWYRSFYPEELVGKELERLFVCPHCFKYTRDESPFMVHMNLCTKKASDFPGQLIYTQGNHGVYEVDGMSHQLFAQNLSLFAKLFLDTKSVFFDVASFNYYLLVHFPMPTASEPTPRPSTVGFFSKEKLSWDNNNLACILVFPPWQRKGLGKILMGVSYELSKREGRFGGPERPLSELGQRGYFQYWNSRVARTILDVQKKKPMSIDELSREAWVLSDDVMATLTRMEILGSKRKDGSLAIGKHAVRRWAEATELDLTLPVCADGFQGDWAT